MQLEIIHELSEGMKGCSTAFVAVAVAGIALTVAASTGLPMEDAPEVRSSSSSSSTQRAATPWTRLALMTRTVTLVLAEGHRMLVQQLLLVVCCAHHGGRTKLQCSACCCSARVLVG
jgi:hypothetical protein